MGLNEFQEAYRCIMHAQGLEFRAAILASFYGSRADADKLPAILDRISIGSEPLASPSVADIPLPYVPTATLVDQGFEKVEIDDGAGQ